jgi:ABC-type glycerol-3-phosphate transport system substrate-binding protein
VPKQTAYARVLSGEIPILLDYDFDAYRAKYKDHANVEFVIPKEGTIAVPYVMSLVKGAPHDANAKKVLDFVLSDEGQKLWASAYLRPVRADARRRSRREVPAGERIRTGQAGRLRQDGDRPAGVRPAVSADHAVSGRNDAMLDLTFPLRWRVALVAPALAVFAAFWLLPMAALVRCPPTARSSRATRRCSATRAT